MYQMSSFSRSLNRSVLRPFTAAQPVIPGRMSCRRRSSGVYFSRYSTSRGRGPTRLMSPRTTFHSSGSSSRLEARRNRPSRVMRCSSVRYQTSPGRVARIVRNL